MGHAPDSASRFGTQVYSDINHCITVVGSCIITYSKQPPDVRYFAAWNAVMARLTEQRRLSVVTIIDSNASIPDEATRKLIRTAMQRYTQSIERFSYVVEGSGFGAAAMRSAISLTNLAARTPYRQKVFATVGEAGVWLSRTSSSSSSEVDASVLNAVAHAMRATVNGLARTG